MKKIIQAVLKEKDQINAGVYRYIVYSPELSNNSKPGQFLNIKCGTGINNLLRRPISISNIDIEKGTVEFIFQVKGGGTRELSKVEEGSTIDLLGPLGDGFLFDVKYKNAAVVGGGIGIFPLIPLIKDLNSYTSTFLGFRDASQIMLENTFKRISDELHISTDDGSFGHRGRITELLENKIKDKEFDVIYACGPKPMLKAVKELSEKYNIPCQISLEERMGCGVGACLGCACKTKSEEHEWDYKHVCKDGPVFWGEEVIFDE